jgi:hypothetical protein
MRDRGPSPGVVAAAGVLAVVAVATTLLGLLPWWAVAALSTLHAWFFWHGSLVVRRVAPEAGAGTSLLVGPVLGLALCTVGLLALWLLGARGAWMFLLAPWPVWALLGLPLHRLAPGLPLPQFDRRDALAAFLLLLVIPLVVTLPYWNVGAPLEDGGRAYRAYFTADFVWAMTAVAEVAKGDIPPKNPFATGDALRYYWLAHFLSAATYRVGGGWGLAIEPIILANSVGYGVAFLLFFHAFVRAWGPGPVAAGAGIVLVFCASSFEALGQAWAWRHRDHLWVRLTDVNIDAVTRWLYDGMPIDGLHRMLLYQPHHLTGYAMGLLALLLVGRARGVRSSPVALTAGALLALSLLYSSFTAIIIGVGVAGLYAARLREGSRPLDLFRCGVLGSVPVGVAVALSMALGYVDPKAGGLLQFGPNPLAFHQAPYMLFLSLGPPLLLGTAGLALSLRHGLDARPVAALVLAAMAFYFFADVPDMGGVWVGWRSGHLLFVAFAVFTGVVFAWTAAQSRRTRRAVWGGSALLALAAVPTVAIDVHNAQDLTNTRSGPSFPWVLRLSKGEVAALEWMRRHTSADAVVQPDAQARANASWGYISAFGERRMAAGLPIAMIPLAPYVRTAGIVHEGLFRQRHLPAATQLARRMGIDYVYLGPLERDEDPDLYGRLLSWPQGFRLAFQNEDVAIFRVVR